MNWFRSLVYQFDSDLPQDCKYLSLSYANTRFPLIIMWAMNEIDFGRNCTNGKLSMNARVSVQLLVVKES